MVWRNQPFKVASPLKSKVLTHTNRRGHTMRFLITSSLSTGRQFGQDILATLSLGIFLWSVFLWLSVLEHPHPI